MQNCGNPAGRDAVFWPKIWLGPCVKKLHEVTERICKAEVECLADEDGRAQRRICECLKQSLRKSLCFQMFIDVYYGK